MRCIPRFPQTKTDTLTDDKEFDHEEVSTLLVGFAGFGYYLDRSHQPTRTC
ncbi:MAG: hypothetical protein ONB44_03210 [candidate division KSB1 bacterium]|nr:hypothetical protein [candidate division KSB1 bacterium]MDZ7301136.1 hypothetical protein [candidate division KSB1 bacterium]MDZ7311980.1 hypothetical protein [candidate division KSB1 bacterium]